MLKMGLIGKNISHSKSKEVYESLLSRKIHYELYDFKSVLDMPSLKELFKQSDFISITNPYKTIFNNQIDKNVSLIPSLGIVNCLKLEDNKILATNTDYPALKDEFLEKKRDKIYILGDGSLSLLLQKMLEDFNQSFEVLSRKRENLDLKALLLDKNSLVINACSRDYLLPQIKKSDASYWDLNYNHSLNDPIAHKSFAQVFDGKSLLRKQAKYALSFWNL